MNRGMGLKCINIFLLRRLRRGIKINKGRGKFPLIFRVWEGYHH
jgi:hypothetical protein